jgi:hypothetical protein
MSELFQNADTFRKFWNGLSEAVPHINNRYSEKGNLRIRADNPSQIFLREGNTVYQGNTFSIYIKGFAVSFWTGLDISNKTEEGKASLYFDKPSNNPDFIQLLKTQKNWEYSDSEKVNDGCRLVCKKGTELNAEDWFNFINEPLEVLLQ